MNTDYNDPGTGAPRPRRASSVAPAGLAWLVATLLLLGGVPPGHAQLTPVITIDAPWVVEGDSGTATLTFTVTLNPASSETVTVKYADAGTGTALSSGPWADYTSPAAGTLTFAPGETEKTIDVTVIGDITDESDQTVVIKLSEPINAELAGGATTTSGTGTIRDDDAVLSFGAEYHEEGDEGTSTAVTFQVGLSTPAGAAGVTVRYRDVTAAGYSDAATSGTDYEAISDNVLEFAAGEYEKTVEVSVIGDRDVEPDEWIVLEFHDLKGARFFSGTDRVAALILNDDGTSPLARTLSIDSPRVAEGDDGTTTLTFTVERSGGTHSVVKVDYADAGSGTATSGGDHEAIGSGTLAFESGETSKTIDVTVNGDTDTEPDETVVITLSNPFNAQFDGDAATVSGTGTIANDDLAITIDAPWVVEGDSGTVTLTFTVTLSPASSETVTVKYADAGTGTALSSGPWADYTPPAAGTLTFAPGDTEKTIDVTVHGDITDESDQTVVIKLSEPTNAEFVGGATELTGTGTIRDDDAVLSFGAKSHEEGDEGTSTAVIFQVGLSSPAGAAGVTVRFRDVTAAGYSDAATSGTDYEAISDGKLEFAAGEYEKTVEVSVIGDRDVEPDELIVLEFHDLKGAEFSSGTDRVAALILNDDGTSPLARTLSIDSPRVTEGDDGTKTLTFTVERGGGTHSVVKVDYADAGGGTATSGEDHEAISAGALTFEAGETSKAIDVTVNGDTDTEPDETVVIALSNPFNAQFAGGAATVSGTGTIENDDSVLSIDAPAVTEGDSGTATLTFTVTLNPASSETVTAKYADARTGTAVSTGTGADYTAPAPGTLTFAPGDTEMTIAVTVNGDTDGERDETVVIALSEATNAQFAGGAATISGTGTIENDDPAITIDAPWVVEGDSGTATLTFTVTLNPASSETVTVKYADAGTGTALSSGPWADYTPPASGTLTFTPGDTEKTIDVTVNGDITDESDQTVVIKLSEPTNAQFPDGATELTGTGTIRDDDAVLSFGAEFHEEGDEGTSTAVSFQVGLSSPAGAAGVTVRYRDVTAAGYSDAATSGTDYEAISDNVLEFARGEYEKTVGVRVIGDRDVEPDEYIVLEFHDLKGAEFSSGIDRVAALILNDDGTSPLARTLSIDSPRVTEGDDGATTLTFTVERSGGTHSVVKVDYADAGTGTATSGGDYLAISSGTLTFESGETEKTIAATVNGDTAAEPDETVVITLSEPTNAQFAGGAATVSGTGTIENDDIPVITIDDPWVAEGQGGTTSMTWTVTLSGASSDTITVAYRDAGTGNAGSGDDYAAVTAATLTFDPGETEKTIDVTVNGDIDDEPDQTVAITLSGPTNAVFPDGASELTGTGTIRNDDNLLTLGVERKEEGDDGTTTFKFTVTLTERAGNTGVKVFYRDVTAVAGVGDAATAGDEYPADYTAISDGELVFAPGEDSQTLEVSVLADRDNEPDERIVLEFHDPKHALFGDGAISERATAVVMNDDGASLLVRTLSIDSPGVDEGDDGTTTLTFTVARSGGTESVVTVDYADAGGGTATSGEDYEAISAGTLTFEAGETSKTIDVTVNGDTDTEPDETVVITLSNPFNAQFDGDAATVSGTGTIANDDAAVVTIEGSSVEEGDGADGESEARLVFTVRLSGPVSHTVTVRYADLLAGSATAAGPDVANADYEAIRPGTLTFAAGETERTLALTVHGDTIVEHHETVVIGLSDPTGAVFAGAAGSVTATGTIRSDDGTPSAPPADPAGTPVADAGADLEVDPEAPVVLDGSGSADPDGKALAYAWSPVSGEEVTLAGADTAAPTFIAPWQPGGLVFSLTVTDPGGLGASDEVTVTVRDLAPGFGSAAVPSPALVPGEALEALVLPEATGGNGALTYGLTSVPAGLAGLSFDPAARRLSGTPTAEGSYAFTWRVEDADENRADSDAAVLTFGVTVVDPRTSLWRKAVKRTLAAVARRSLSSALENIGARFASSIPDSGLTLAGATVPFGAARTPGWAGTPGLDGAVGLNGASGLGGAPGLDGTPDLDRASGLGGASVLNGAAVLNGMSVLNGAAGGCFVSVPHPHGFRAEMHSCPSPAMQSRDVETGEMLRTSAFSLTLGAAEESGPGGAPGARWAVWGRGDLGTFAGRPEPGVRYDGELRTGWLGIDARAGRWVAGLALSHGRGEADYGFDENGHSGQGRLETTLNALYPYGRWTFREGLELRAVLGAGTGEAHHVPDDGPPETSDLSMRMASLGVRRELPALGKVGLAVRADASVARLETDSGPQYIDNLTADTWRGRVGVEASRPFTIGEEAELTPFVEAAGRRDGGDGLTGAGVELAGGVRYRAPGLELEARGRWLAAHTEAGARERGVSVTARVGPGAHGRGLSLLLAPRWGAETDGAETLWQEEMPGFSAGTGGEAASLDARVGYGLALSPRGPLSARGLLTPFAETGLGSGDRQRLRLGTRFDASRMDLGVELAGERTGRDAADPEHALTLDVTLRF